MFYALLLLFSLGIFGYAQTSTYPNNKTTAPSKQVPYDADLFRKDVEVVSANVEFLYWTIEEGGLDYAIKMNQTAWSNNTASFAVGRYEVATYNMDPGFRLAVGYYNAPKYWELKLTYTRMTNRGSNAEGKPSPDQEFIVGTWSQLLNTPMAGAQAFTHFNYNLTDLWVARVFNPNPHLRMKLIFGLTGTWMSQDFRIRYFDSSLRVTKIKSHWDYEGGGVRMGTYGDWYWGNNVYLTGMASTSLLMGKYTNRSFIKTTAISGDQNPSLPAQDAVYRDVRPALAIQLLIGPCWEKNFPKNRYEVFAGYELTSWFNLQETIRSSGSTPSDAKITWINSSAFGIHGLTTRVSIDF